MNNFVREKREKTGCTRGLFSPSFKKNRRLSKVEPTVFENEMCIILGFKVMSFFEFFEHFSYLRNPKNRILMHDDSPIRLMAWRRENQLARTPLDAVYRHFPVVPPSVKSHQGSYLEH